MQCVLEILLFGLYELFYFIQILLFRLFRVVHFALPFSLAVLCFNVCCLGSDSLADASSGLRAITATGGRMCMCLCTES